jgi:hypothetical protein
MVQEMVHPKGFDFRAQKRIVMLRDVKKMKRHEIAQEVVDLQGETPRPRLCATYYQNFSAKLGRVKRKYDKCGPQEPQGHERGQGVLAQALGRSARTVALHILYTTVGAGSGDAREPHRPLHPQDYAEGRFQVVAEEAEEVVFEGDETSPIETCERSLALDHGGASRQAVMCNGRHGPPDAAQRPNKG